MECFYRACGGRQVYTSDTSICDQVHYENVSSGFVAGDSAAAFQFEVAGGSGGNFIYTFEGNFTESTQETRHGVRLQSATVIGTYGSTPGGCNNGEILNQGTYREVVSCVDGVVRSRDTATDGNRARHSFSNFKSRRKPTAL